jgi:hypothetical protein
MGGDQKQRGEQKLPKGLPADFESLSKNAQKKVPPLTPEA